MVFIILIHQIHSKVYNIDTFPVSNLALTLKWSRVSSIDNTLWNFPDPSDRYLWSVTNWVMTGNGDLLSHQPKSIVSIDRYVVDILNLVDFLNII